MAKGTAASTWDPRTDMPSLAGKVILVTGANNGLGKQSVIEYARHDPALIYMTARDLAKGKAAMEEIKKQVPNANLKLLQLDLASFESVKAAANTVLAESARLDILLLNAGIMASAPAVTKEGYEVQFGTNHMGHALLTKLLLPVLENTAATDPSSSVRVILVASGAYLARDPTLGIDFSALKSTMEAAHTYTRYGQSKQAQISYGRELARRHPSIRVASIHPGRVKSNLNSSMTGLPIWARWIDRLTSYQLDPVEKGVRNQMWASVESDFESGEYLEPVGERGKYVTEGLPEGLDAKLWEWTETELQPHVLQL